MGITKWPMESKFAKYEHFKQPKYRTSRFIIGSARIELHSLIWALFIYLNMKLSEEQKRRPGQSPQVGDTD